MVEFRFIRQETQWLRFSRPSKPSSSSTFLRKPSFPLSSATYCRLAFPNTMPHRKVAEDEATSSSQNTKRLSKLTLPS
jgi:hypothetical protein